MPTDFYQQYRDLVMPAFTNPAKITDANSFLKAQAFAGPLPFESVIAESHFDHGRLAEVQLYPVDPGFGMKLTESGIRRRASAEVGPKILQRLQAISAPYGTRIEIGNMPPLNYVGIIRP